MSKNEFARSARTGKTNATMVAILGHQVTPLSLIKINTARRSYAITSLKVILVKKKYNIFRS